MRWIPALLLVAWLIPPAQAGDLTAEEAAAIVARDRREPPFPFEGQPSNPLVAVGGTQQDADQLAAAAAPWLTSIGRETAIFAALTRTADPRLQRLADRFQGVVSLPAVERLTPEAAATLAGHVDILVLPGLVELSPEAAAALAAQPDLRIRVPPGTPPATLKPLGGALTLLGVDDPAPQLLEAVAREGSALVLPDTLTLGPAAAGVLAANTTSVELPGLKQLPLDVATALGGGRADRSLTLDGIEEISPEVVAALGKQRKVSFQLRGLKRLSAAAAKPLVGNQGDLHLSSLESLDADTAAVLARHPSAIYLPALRRLEADVIRGLAAHRSFLDVGSREPLSTEAAAALCGRRQQTAVALSAIDPATARILAAGVKGFDLELRLATPPPGDVVDILATNRLIFFDRDRLTTLSITAARAFAAQVDVHLSFAGLTELSPALAAALATNNKNVLWLNGLKTLSPDVARELAGHQGDLGLMGLESLDRGTATLLAGHRGALHLGLKRLPPEVAHGLARHHQALQCDQLEALDPRAAAALTRGPETLSFNGLREIDAETARALAAHDGTVFLSGLASLPPEVAEPLLADRPPAAQGRRPEVVVELALLTGLTPRLAEAIVQRGNRNGEEFEFAGVETLDSAEVARVLATTQQRIALPRLRKVTPAAVFSLRKNPLVEMPANEALEFLPNADGTTDDFVSP